MIFLSFLSAIDFSVFPSLQGGPHNNVISAVAVALREASTPKFSEYIKSVKENAKELGENLITLGYNLQTNGTDNHLILMNLRNKNITGNKIEYILEKVGISVNKNSVKDDKSALSPSGIRIGLCAMTSGGLIKEKCSIIADFIHRAINIAIKINCKKLVDFRRLINEDKEVIMKINILQNDILNFTRQFPELCRL